MSAKDYLKDHIFPVFFYILNFMFILFCLIIFKMNPYAIVLICISVTVSGLLIFINDYRKANVLFSQLHSLTMKIDKKYLMHEMMEVPETYEGKLMFEFLRQINTSMIHEIKEYKLTIDDFKQYLELWIHEIKIPLAGARLIIENNKNNVGFSLVEELNRIESLVEQVLFYVRSENVEKDYTIKECILQDIVNQAIMGFRKSFIYKKIELELGELQYAIYSDPKWLLFILQQIITNAIKYTKESNAKIKIYAKVMPHQIVLYVEDNGIGISSTDIRRVFDKGFTGENGRLKYKSTGIGLYLCKSLCDKLHHSIAIQSFVNEKTIVCVTFPINESTIIIK